MKGAREYCKLFKNKEIIGKLKFTCGSHARGSYFHVYVIYENKQVEVYGILGGQPGWTEWYGWLKKGKWIDDFNAIVERKKDAFEMRIIQENKKRELDKEELKMQEQDILDKY